ncbi:Ig-like domain-containing protein [Paenibacillus sp. WQ 127069]|uniref:Ig-like domain-containing protein n=1 Tax=Paenibacillus baimaensis TaxID=2982185 RepID=A0ABT2UKH1_9BACL|nr:Ig-like domain-containing protein [Paenibacillus sp. WQ 127069]MCU6795138.1 Ig-like domain-containing protein [Paenibacillus sp. WQ 127069]
MKGLLKKSLSTVVIFTLLIISVLPGLAFAAPILVSSVSITNPAATVAMGGTLQMGATVSPPNATNPTLTWSIMPATGNASISSSGLLTPVLPGLVVVKAEANDGSNKGTSVIVTITATNTLVTGITVTSAGNAISLNTGATLQLTATVAPVGATNRAVVWTSSSTALATVSSSGLVKALTTGIVTITATAADGSGILGTIPLSIMQGPVPSTSITITSPVSTVVLGQTLQMTGVVGPANATNKNVNWYTQAGTGTASISNTGLLTGDSLGTVKVYGQPDDAATSAQFVTITVIPAPILVSSILVASLSVTNSVYVGSSVQMLSHALPADASNDSVTWTVAPGTGTATINSTTGSLTGVTTGTVTVTATANDGSGVHNSFVMTVESVNVPVTGLEISSSAVSLMAGNTLQITSAILPINATNKNVVWSVINMTGSATISNTGLLTGVTAGTIEIKALAADGSNTTSSIIGFSITPGSNAPVPATGIVVTSASASVETGKTLQLGTVLTPTNATNQSVAWSVYGNTGTATIDSAGLLTAGLTGDVTVTAATYAGSAIKGTKVITITRVLTTPVTGITVDSDGSVTAMFINRTLTFNATVTPSEASNKDVTWSVINGTGTATITDAGVLTSTAGGTVTVVATAKDGSGVTGSKAITIMYTQSRSSGSSGSGVGPVVTTPTTPTTPTVPVQDPNTPVAAPPVANGLIYPKSDIAALAESIKATIASSKPTQTFRDMINHWSDNSVNVFTQLGILDGYDDGTFKPDASITRGEFATIIVKAFKVKAAETKAPALKDVDNHWSKDDVQKLVDNGIINGYEDGSFKPNANITRAEEVAIIARVADIEKANKVSDTKFNDVGTSWNQVQIQQAAAAGIVSGQSEGTFAPNSSSTRAESLAIVLRTMQLNPDIKTLLQTLGAK